MKAVPALLAALLLGLPGCATTLCPAAPAPDPSLPPTAYVLFLGDEAVATPAPRAANFTLDVEQVDTSAARVQLRGHGVVLATKDLDILMDGNPPVKKDSVEFERVPLVESNDYTVSLLDAHGNATYTSPPLKLWGEPKPGC